MLLEHFLLHHKLLPLRHVGAFDNIGLLWFDSQVRKGTRTVVVSLLDVRGVGWCASLRVLYLP